MSATPQPASVTRPQVSLSRFILYFLRLGTIGFGGPIALVAYMQRDLVDRFGWIARDDYLDGLALSQLAPGPLAAQLAIYLGYVRARFIGATLAGLAFVGPSFVMVLLIAMAYTRFGGLPWMSAVFYGVGAAVIGIIARSATKLARATLGSDATLWSIFAILAVTTAVTGREIVPLLIGAGFVPLVLQMVRERRFAIAPKLMLFPAVLSHLSFNGLSWQLLFFFGKAGLFVFGSGLAIVPFLYGGVVQQHHWLTDRQFTDAVAVAMITPGPVVITVAFIGYLVNGVSGAVAAALGVFVPVYAVVLILGPRYKRIAKNQYVHLFVRGVTAAAVGAIAGAVVVLARRTIHDGLSGAICVATILVLFRWKIPEPFVVLVAGLLGLAAWRP